MLKRVARTILGDPHEKKIRQYQDRVDAINALEPTIEKLF